MRGTRLSLVTLAVLAATALASATALAVVPANGGMVGGTQVTVAASPGDQNDPHLDGDVVSFTDHQPFDSRIRYFSFSTSLTAAVPFSPGDVDLLSDVASGRVSFSRVMADRTAAMVFDTSTLVLTEVDPLPGGNRLGASIGGDTVAFVNLLSGGGDIFAADLATSATPTNVSAAAEFERDPSVSPDGNAIVWQRDFGSTSGIMKAARLGGVWGSTSVVADTAANEYGPDTDGVSVAYASDRATSLGGTDIYLRSLAGGAELQLEINGVQQNPALSAGVISFESTPVAPGAESDLFVYVVATNTLWQVTDTPAVGEHLSDIRVLPNGDVRVVWAVDEDSSLTSLQDVYARTFSIPLGGGDTTPPSVAIATPADGALYTKSQFVLADYACADEPGGSGLASCAGPVASGAPIDTASVGAHAFAVTGADNAGNAVTLTHGYGVVFCVTPFAPPVDDLPVLNRVNAGRSIPVKFSVCGNQGLAVLAAGYPKSQQVACDSSAPVDGIEETTTAGNSTLSYDAASDQYTYVWKTEKSWAGSCRQLVLQLADGSYRRAIFQLR